MKGNAKSKLCEALVRLSKKKNIDEIQVKELIHEAEINPSSYYYHYGAVSDIVDDIIMAFADCFVQTLKEADYHKPDVMLGIYEFIFEHREEYLCVYNSSYREKMTTALTQTLDDINRHLDIFFKKPDGDLFTLKPQDEELYIHIVSRMEIEFINYWAEHYFDRTPEEMIRIEVGQYFLRHAFAIPKLEKYNAGQYPQYSLLEVEELYK